MPSPPKSTTPRSSLTAVKRAPAACSCVELGEHDVLGGLVDQQRAVAALAARAGLLTRSAIVGRSASMSRIAADARRHAPSQSGASGSEAAAIRAYPTAVPVVLTSAQREAVEHGRRPLLVLGGAGPARRTALVERFAWLAAATAPESLLALTLATRPTRCASASRTG